MESAMIDQLTVCLPNEPGRLAQMSRAMGADNIQIRALMVADTTDFGIIRIVCDRPQDALSLLRGLGYDATLTQVVGIEVSDVPGGLGVLLDHLASADLNVEYAYTCPMGGRTIDIVKVTGEPLAIKLRESGLTMVSAEELCTPRRTV
jgi:hypothetical protein